MFFQKPVTSVEKQKTQFVLNVDELLSEFEKDETHANEKYLDKVIEVSGSVESIKKEGSPRSL